MKRSFMGPINTTKSCPQCGNTHLVALSRYHVKICQDHYTHIFIPWYRDKGQPYTA
jgi:hypothetical protein